MFDVRTSKPGKMPAVLKKGLRAAESGAIAAEWGRYIAGCKMHWKVFEREEREWRAAEDRRMAASTSPKARRWRGIPQSRVIDFWRDRARDRDMPSLAQRARRAWSLLPSAAVVEGVHAVMHARDTPLRSRQLDSTVVGEGILTTNSCIVSHLLSHPAEWRRRVDAAVVVRRQLRAAARHASAIDAEDEAAAAAAADAEGEGVAAVSDVDGTAVDDDAAVPADAPFDAAQSARDAELEAFLRTYAELVAGADEVLAELTTDGDELVQDECEVTGVSTFEDDEWEQYMRAADVERPGVALVVD